MKLVEEWRQVVGFIGYDVSNLGRVRSYWVNKGVNTYISTTPQRILKPGVDGYGYYHVVLCLDGKHYIRKIHKLVAETFIGSCPPGEEVCHGPGGRQDNSVKNLEYGTHKKNMGEDCRRDNSFPDRKGENGGRHILTKEQVIWIRKNYKPRPKGHNRCVCHKDWLTQKQIAQKLNISRETIRDITLNKSWV